MVFNIHISQELKLTWSLVAAYGLFRKTSYTLNLLNRTYSQLVRVHPANSVESVLLVVCRPKNLPS
ncbi:hypothetical protein M378DRAFT_807061 [Amanita muscaria Koide BX008]|uniref:Uncharacterized protein n=1 Tax=Amanita muscaria (strain Koide BX008) TaxID=946122 RepID=A0A0C2WKG8_AMAMK|nr:hypothetical protein M378DRAFT_807061 [Amanita muscaria Koide BX008]